MKWNSRPFFGSHHVVVVAGWTTGRSLGTLHFWTEPLDDRGNVDQLPAVWEPTFSEAVETSLFRRCSRDKSLSLGFIQHVKCRHRSCFPVWYFLSFDGRWWGWLVHLIHLGPIWGLLTAVYRVDSTTEGLEPYDEFCMFLWMHLFTN